MQAGRTVRTLRTVALGTAYVASWLVLSALAFAVLFTASTRTVNLASHDAVLRPTFDSRLVVHTGPFLPDVRFPSGSRIGAEVTLGKTDVASTQQLMQRYAYLAGAPEGTEAKVRTTIVSLAREAAVRALLLGALPVLVWVLLGRDRRHQLVLRIPTARGVLVVLVAAGLVVGLWQPWRHDDQTMARRASWVPLETYLDGSVPLPAGLEEVQLSGGATTTGSKRLIQSAISTYDKSQVFYSRAAQAAAELALRVPAEDETVVALVSDRHDNIGMDRVAKAIGERGGATAVFDAGDDTATGSEWEAFSLDSLDAAFRDLGDLGERFGVAGNHDHGRFVASYLADHGWTMLDGEVVDGPGGSTLLGVDDPRSSGLGDWRDQTGLSFAEVGDRIAAAACAAQEDGQRVATILVHDANLGREALERGCADLVVGGHTHVARGPERVVGSNGDVGWTYTTGTTGGAAYAFALGSKPRREAQVTLLTYRAGRPVGVQAVRLQTDGGFTVDAYVGLEEPPATR